MVKCRQREFLYIFSECEKKHRMTYLIRFQLGSGNVVPNLLVTFPVTIVYGSKGQLVSESSVGEIQERKKKVK